MKKLQRLLAFFLTLGCAAALAADEPGASLVSFADLYRMTVAGRVATADGPASLSFAEPGAEPQLRVAALHAQGAPAPRFRVAPGTPAPGRWMLLLAGLAAFGWVAHRRLSRFL